jgi:hypothetical protein
VHEASVVESELDVKFGFKIDLFSSHLTVVGGRLCACTRLAANYRATPRIRLASGAAGTLSKFVNSAYSTG